MGIERSTNSKSKKFRAHNALDVMKPDIHQVYLKAGKNHIFINPTVDIDLNPFLGYLRRGHKVHVFISLLDSLSFDLASFVKEVNRHDVRNITIHSIAHSLPLENYIYSTFDSSLWDADVNIEYHNHHPAMFITAKWVYELGGKFTTYGLILYYIEDLRIWSSCVVPLITEGSHEVLQYPKHTEPTIIWPMPYSDKNVMDELYKEFNKWDVEVSRSNSRKLAIPKHVNYML